MDEKKSATDKSKALPSEAKPPPSDDLVGEERGPGPPPQGQGGQGGHGGPPPAHLVKVPPKRMGGWARLKGQSAPPPPTSTCTPSSTTSTTSPATAPSHPPAPPPAPTITSSPVCELPLSLVAAPSPGDWDKFKDESSTPETPASTTNPAPGGWGAQLGCSEPPALIPSLEGAQVTTPHISSSPGVSGVADNSELVSNLAQFKVRLYTFLTSVENITRF